MLLHLMLHLELLHLMVLQPRHCHHGWRGGSRTGHWSYTRSHFCLLQLAPLLCLLRLLAPVIIGNSVHSHNGAWKISPFGNRVLNKSNFYFVNSAAVQAQRVPRLHALVARVALEMPRPLMLDENTLKRDVRGMSTEQEKLAAREPRPQRFDHHRNTSNKLRPVYECRHPVVKHEKGWRGVNLRIRAALFAAHGNKRSLADKLHKRQTPA